MDLIIKLIGFLPQNIISYLVGWLVRLRLPTPVARALNNLFVAIFRIDMTEAEYPLEHYESIEAVFTRRLKPGMRPPLGEVCSPADGTLSRSEPAANNTAVQAKGLTYRLDELVFGPGAVLPAGTELNWYVTVYLAPHNYHRVHSPVDGSIKRLRYFPGELWPVNQPSVRSVPRLFVRNERLVFDIALAGGGTVYAVMVGALNVGRIEAAMVDGFATNDGGFVGERLSRVIELPSPYPVAAGQEIGTFMLGSTVVLVFDNVAADRFRLVQSSENRPILMGHSLLDAVRQS